MNSKWLKQWCCYQLDSIVTSGVVHTSTCGSGCGSGATIKWVPTPFCVAVAVAKQHILHYIVCYFTVVNAAQYEHFGPIAAEKPLPLLHRVNGPLAKNSKDCFAVIIIIACGLK